MGSGVPVEPNFGDFQLAGAASWSITSSSGSVWSGMSDWAFLSVHNDLMSTRLHVEEGGCSGISICDIRGLQGCLLSGPFWTRENVGFDFVQVNWKDFSFPQLEDKHGSEQFRFHR